MTLQEKANEVVRRLVGCSLTSFGRAANLFWFTYSNLTLHSPERTNAEVVSEYALHIQCRWRIRKGTKILIGYRDLHYPKDYPENLDIEDFDWDEIGSSRFDMLCENLQDDFKNLKVESAKANELGELTIFLEKSFNLETFIDDSLQSENWRFFLKDRKPHMPHWVQTGNQLTGE